MTCLVCNKCFFLLHRVVNVCPGIISIYMFPVRKRVQTGPRGVLFQSPFSEFILFQYNFHKYGKISEYVSLNLGWFIKSCIYSMLSCPNSIQDQYRVWTCVAPTHTSNVCIFFTCFKCLGTLRSSVERTK